MRTLARAFAGIAAALVVGALLATTLAGEAKYTCAPATDVDCLLPEIGSAGAHQLHTKKHVERLEP